MFTLADFLTTTGAVAEDESERLSRMSVTLLSPLLTTIEPSEQLPVIRYVPAVVIVSVVPSIV